MIPRDPETGDLLINSNPFDNKFITPEGTMSENNKNQIEIKQAQIPTENYLQSYITFLDLCLHGIVSPSTLGIDTKKLDNAESQREKEKTTLYTRGLIIDTLAEFIPPKDIDISLKFGEYSNPSFEAQVETVGKGRQRGIMSIEASVEELYGDSKDDKWKSEEIARLKSEQGIIDIEEPAVNFDVEMEDTEQDNIEKQVENVEGQKEEKQDQE